MSSGGYTAFTMVIDFSRIDGTLVVAVPPDDMSIGRAREVAEGIFKTVRKAYDDDYAKYATGGFDTLAAIRKELDKVKAKVIAIEQESYL